jgi:hypothetical protein
VVVVLTLPVSVVIASDDVVSDVMVFEVVVDDVVVVVVVAIAGGAAGPGRLERLAVCTTANPIAMIMRTVSIPEATTAVLV